MQNLPIKLDNTPAVQVFTPKKMDEILAGIKEHVESIVPDISTNKGRDEIKSLAHNVSKSKVALDKLGKELVADKKAEIKLVDNERKKARDFLDQLRDDTKKPVTEWEEAEEKRVDDIVDSIEKMNAMANTDGMPASEINLMIESMKAVELGEHLYQEFLEQAEFALASTLRKLEEAYDVQLKYEQDQAELEALRKEKEERDEKERQEREAAEQKARHEAIRKEAEKKAKKEAAEREAKLKEQKARALLQKKEATAREKKAKEEKKAAEAKAKQDAIDAAEKAKQEEIARQKREAEEKKAAEAKRKADDKHRERFNKEAVYFIKGMLGITEEQATRVVDAISNNEVPHISIKY